MSVETVKTRLVEICDGLTGVKGASREPRNIAGAEMPWVIVLAGPTEYATDSEVMSRDLRTYRLILVVQAWVQGPEYEAEKLAEPFFERFRTEFTNNVSLDTGNNDPLLGVQWSQLIRDTGVSDVQLAGALYSGVEFNIQVLELFNVCRR